MHLTQKMRKALSLAVEGHNGQLDKSGKQYISHCIRVAIAVIEYGEDAFCVAVCHDLVEDTDVTLDDIEALLGKEVRDGVDAVSRRIGENGVKEIYQVFVSRSSQNALGKIVKIADLKDNLSPERLLALPESERGVQDRYRKALLKLEGEKDWVDLKKQDPVIECIFKERYGTVPVEVRLANGKESRAEYSYDSNFIYIKGRRYFMILDDVSPNNVDGYLWYEGMQEQDYPDRSPVTHWRYL